MESKVIGEELFPKNLGFGTLDESKIRVEESQDEKVYHAVYLAGSNDIVYTIQVKPGCCCVEEYFENQRVCITRSKDLKEAWLQKFTNFGENSARFQALVNRITQGKNITVVNPGGSKRNLISFPEGLIFRLWLPIWSRTRMKGIDEAKDLKGPLHFFSQHKGTIITMNRDHDLIQFSMPILEFTASLSELEEAVTFFYERGWIDITFFREVGLHILATADAQAGDFRVYPTSGDKRLLAYSLLLNREGDISLGQAKEYIREAVDRNKNDLAGAPSAEITPPEVWDLVVGGMQWGTIVGFEKKKCGIFCITCYRERYGNVIYLGDTEQIFDEKTEKDFRRGTSGFYMGEEEVILCNYCWRVILRIPRHQLPPTPRSN